MLVQKIIYLFKNTIPKIHSLRTNFEKISNHQTNLNTELIENINSREGSSKEINIKVDTINKEINNRIDSINEEINAKIDTINEEIKKNNTLQMDFTFDQVKLFNLLNKDKKYLKINKFKNASIPIFIFLYLMLSYFLDGGEFGFSNYSFSQLQSNFEYKLLNNPWVICTLIAYLIISFLLVLWLANHIHSSVYEKLELTKPVKMIKKECKYFFLSPDLFYAKYYKEMIKQSCKEDDSLFEDEMVYTDRNDNDINTFQWNKIKILSKFFVENSNWSNINYTLVIILILYVISIFNLSIFGFSINELLLTMVIFRLFSRGIEITISFYKDVVRVDSKLFIPKSGNVSNSYYINGFKSTLIRQSERLSLAIHTLIELVILYAFIYYLFFNIIIDLPNFNGIAEGVNAPTFFEMILFSSSLGLFNISYNAYANILLAIFHFSQVMLSGILLLLSIAQYIGADKTLSPEEEVFYRYSELLNNKHTKNEIEQKLDNENTILPKE